MSFAEQLEEILSEGLKVVGQVQIEGLLALEKGGLVQKDPRCISKVHPRKHKHSKRASKGIRITGKVQANLALDTSLQPEKKKP